MLCWPNTDWGTLVTANYTSGQPSFTTGTLVTANSTTHTLSSTFTTLITPTHDCYALYIQFKGVGGSTLNSNLLVNIYKGDASAEQNFIMGLNAGYASGTTTLYHIPKVYWFPIFLPANTRLSAKSQGAISSDTVRVVIRAVGGGKPPHWIGTGVEALGVNTGTSRGVLPTSGTTSDGSFIDLGTSTQRYGYVQLQMGGGSDTALSGIASTADIGVSTTPVPGLSDWIWGNNTSEDVWPMMDRGRFCDIPAGTTLRVRAQSSGTADTLDYILHGVY